MLTTRRGRALRSLLPALALAGTTVCLSQSAVAAPPDAPAVPAPLTKVPDGFVAPGTGPVAEKPSLLKELPIAGYVSTGVSAIIGAIVNVFGGNAANDLKDPAKHPTPEATHSLVVKARVGEVVSGVFFVFTGASTVWSTVGTVRTVMKISKYAKDHLPTVGVSAVPVEGGVVVGAVGRF